MSFFSVLHTRSSTSLRDSFIISSRSLSFKLIIPSSFNPSSKWCTFPICPPSLVFKFDKFPLKFSFWYFWIKKKKVECKLWNLSQTRCLPTASLTCIDRAQISSLVKLGLWYVFYILAVRIKWDNVYLGHIYWVWRRVGSAINVDSFFFSFGDANLGHTCGLLARFYFYSALPIILSSSVSFLKDECISWSFAQRFLHFIMTFFFSCPQNMEDQNAGSV